MCGGGGGIYVQHVNLRVRSVCVCACGGGGGVCVCVWGGGGGGGGGVYVQHVNLRAARKFTGTWSPHMRHTIVSTPSYLGTSQKGKSHDMVKKNLGILFFYNLLQYLLISGYNNTCCSKH